MHNSGMIYGYARVSSTRGRTWRSSSPSSTLPRMHQDLSREGQQPRRPSGPSSSARSARLMPATWLMVTATDRLARNTRDLLNMLHAVKEAGAGFRSIAEPMVDTTSQFAEVIIAVLGIVASWERQRITERTSAGRAQAKERGVKFGRRSALTPHQQSEALQRLAAGHTQRTVAALLGVDQATISRLHRSRG